MDIHTQAVHAGDRRKAPAQIPVTTPVYTASSFSCDSMEALDRVIGREEPGFSYGRYDNPTNAALEEQVRTLEGGHGALACSSGMTAMQIAIETALTGGRRAIVAADALYGATLGMLRNILMPAGVEVRFVDACDTDAVRTAIAEVRPGCVLLETISNPLLRVPAIDAIAELARAADAALLVDSTFATPLLVRPLSLGAHLVVHSATKFLAGHGDVLGGVVVSGEAHYETLRRLSRITGPVLGPFESYLTMRGIKTFPLRMERQCANALRVAASLAGHAKVGRVHYPADPGHPDAAAIRRLFAPNLFGAMISLELKDAGRPEVFRFMDAMKLIVRATSLGDVHTLALYPMMSSHREAPKTQREDIGIGSNLVRLSIGIESADDIIADLAQALG